MRARNDAEREGANVPSAATAMTVDDPRITKSDGQRGLIRRARIGAEDLAGRSDDERIRR